MLRKLTGFISTTRQILRDTPNDVLINQRALVLQIIRNEWEELINSPELQLNYHLNKGIYAVCQDIVTQTKAIIKADILRFAAEQRSRMSTQREVTVIFDEENCKAFHLDVIDLFPKYCKQDKFNAASKDRQNEVIHLFAIAISEIFKSLNYENNNIVIDTHSTNVVSQIIFPSLKSARHSVFTMASHMRLTDRINYLLSTLRSYDVIMQEEKSKRQPTSFLASVPLEISELQRKYLFFMENPTSKQVEFYPPRERAQHLVTKK